MSRRPTTDPPTVRSPLHSHPRRAGLTPLPLPALPFSFVGRDADVARLLSLLSCHAVVAVEGAAGIGKTAVLAATASALRRRHPAVYLSTPSSPTEEEFWAHLLVNLGKPIPPGTPGQLLSHQALTALEERQTLLLADDFHQLPRAVAASVLRELRSSIETCKVIVASRTSVPFPAVPTMVLEGLSASASAALVARCTGRTARARAPRGFVHVHQLVHGHPLAIKLGARHPDVLSGGVMLRDRAEYEPDLESLLLVPLVAGLSMAQLEVMALATLAGGKLPKAVLGKLGLDARIRSELVRRHLMEAAPDGLGTPNLLGEHVLARLDRARVRELRHRLAAAFKAGYRGQPHETRWLLEAVDLFFRSGSHVEAAAVLERNRTALIERGLAREYLSRLAVMPPAVASQYVHLAIDHARLIMQFHGENALARAILERLVEDQDPTSAACAAVGLAELELTRGDRGRALTLLEEVLAVGGRALTAEHRVRALVRVGELWAEVGRRTDARRAFREALRMLALRGDRLLASEALVGLARLL
ncbi:MAG: AAA family ATPase [Candidatus Riflebacteria bacterium]|nr:AAA family ATPase [Candidatus Riflebacteria bacterium]